MRLVTTTSKYRRDVRRAAKRGLDIEKLNLVVEAIQLNGEAPDNCRPHVLAGDWSGFWECHIAPDWLLVYLCDEERLTLYRTGTHSDLF